MYKDSLMHHLSEGSNGAGKNEFASQFTCLQTHLYVKYRRRKYNK